MCWVVPLPPYDPFFFFSSLFFNAFPLSTTFPLPPFPLVLNCFCFILFYLNWTCMYRCRRASHSKQPTMVREGLAKLKCKNYAIEIVFSQIFIYLSIYLCLLTLNRHSRFWHNVLPPVRTKLSCKYFKFKKAGWWIIFYLFTLPHIYRPLVTIREKNSEVTCLVDHFCLYLNTELFLPIYEHWVGSRYLSKAKAS